MYAICQDMPGITEADYEKVRAELGGADLRAEGLLSHVAGPVDGGFRIINTWTSKAAAERFRDDHLSPAVQRAHGDRSPELQAAFQSLAVEG